MLRISLEGIDGSGKGVQVQELARYFRSMGASPKLLSEPGVLREEIFEAGRAVERGEVQNTYVSYLFGKAGFLARKQNAFLYENCSTVIRDRDTGVCQYAYHHELGTPDDMLYLHCWIMNQIYPAHAVVLIDVPVDVAIERIKKRGGTVHEYFEKRSRLEKVRSNYLQVFDGDPALIERLGLGNTRLLKVDGTQEVDRVTQDIIEALSCCI